MQENRIYGDNIDIDKESVLQVFSKVAKSAVSPLGSCMLDMKDKYAIERHWGEAKRLLLMFQKSDYKILDIGCGIGRLREVFHESSYHGIDFCKEYIDIAKQRTIELENNKMVFPNRTKYDCMSVNEMITKILDSKAYDVIICCGVLMYLSDSDVVQLLKWLQQSKKQFYIRESISLMNKRLTLKEFPSEDLGISYSAIYRTRAEYVKLFNSVFPRNVYIHTSPLLQPSNKQLRKETNQVYFTWEA